MPAHAVGQSGDPCYGVGALIIGRRLGLVSMAKRSPAAGQSSARRRTRVRNSSKLAGGREPLEQARGAASKLPVGEPRLRRPLCARDASLRRAASGIERASTARRSPCGRRRARRRVADPLPDLRAARSRPWPRPPSGCRSARSRCRAARPRGTACRHVDVVAQAVLGDRCRRGTASRSCAVTRTSSRLRSIWFGRRHVASKTSVASGTRPGCATQVPSWPSFASRSLSARTFGERLRRWRPGRP